jgi:hypothetical protein
MWGYFLPLLSALVAAFTPAYDPPFTEWIIAVFVILLIMPIVLVFRFPTNKAKAYRLTIMYQLYAFSLFLIFPLLKVLKEETFYQWLLLVLFISMYYLARLDQRTEVPFVFPDKARKNNKIKTWIAYMYYVIPAIISFLGVGGDHIKVRILFQIYGDEVMFPYFSTLIYIFSCWLFFFFSSMAYKSHVKEGYFD